MTFSANRNSFYNFTQDLYLIKHDNFKWIYEKAISDIKGILSGEENFYSVDSRTFDLVSIIVNDFSEEFKKKENIEFSDLKKVMEEYDGREKFKFDKIPKKYSFG